MTSSTILYVTLLLAAAAVTGQHESIYDCHTSSLLGMITGQIEDWQITASSTMPANWDKRCLERFARVYQTNGHAWCPKYKSSSEWLQVDLGVPSKITGLMTQGRADGNEWVTSYMVSYSLDAFRWKYITDQYGNQKVFEGNTDSFRVKHTYLDEHIFARFIKFHTIHWHSHPSLRVEIVGCQTCKKLLALPPYGIVTASSERKTGRACAAEDGFILSNTGWCAKNDDANQWLQFDVGPPTIITGLVTKGRGDTGRKHWVTRFKVSYSNDTKLWYFYKDASHLLPKEFGGNADSKLERYHFLNVPFAARYVRVHPVAWNGKIAMRAGVIGCAHAGQCGDGFTKVNRDTPCVANIAYKKETWVNSRRQMKRHAQSTWVKGHAARAVDGNTDQQLHSCTILDNFYIEKPVWMVDLGTVQRVSGVIIMTSLGKDKDKQPVTETTAVAETTQNDYMYNLDKLVVHVDAKGQLTDDVSHICGFVSRLNDAILRPRLHIQCIRPLEGRYVHVEAIGQASQRGRLFSAILCEVMVYS